MNDPFVERNGKTRNMKGQKVSGGMVETRSQKASEEKKGNVGGRDPSEPRSE